MNKDITGDGFCGALYYNRGHVTFKRSLFSKVLTALAAVGFVFVMLVVVGSVLNVKPAQNVLETLIAGKSTPIVEQMRSEDNELVKRI